MITKLEELNQKLINDIDELRKILIDQNDYIEILEKKVLKAKSENCKLKSENFDLKETLELMKKNATPGTTSHNARGAGRKPKITEKEIAEIQLMRKQGKTLQEIQNITGISYGNVQKYSKL